MLTKEKVSLSLAKNSMHPFSKKSLCTAIALCSTGLSSYALAELSIETSEGWKFGVNGHVPVFAIFNDADASEEDAFRITTGFNPATAQFNIYAPTQNGLDVSAHFQLNSHLAGADGVQNSGYGLEGKGRVSGVESRVAEVVVAGDFGTVNIGKGYGIFGTPAIGDHSSGMGVGFHDPNSGASASGRIGNGYFYANFNPRVIYTSNDMNGLQYKIGAFQPEKPGADIRAETEMPRIEANIVWTGDDYSLWSSGFIQSVDSSDLAVDDFTMNGIDFGGSLSLGDLVFRANYSITKGTGNGIVGGHGFADGAKEEKADQWYVEAIYNMNQMTLMGISHGEGSDDLDNSESEFSTLFTHHKITDSLTLMTELQYYDNNTGGDYNAVILGSQFTF